MAKEDARIAERPEGVSEKEWAAKLAYQDEQAKQEDFTRTSFDARRASDAVRGRQEPQA